MNALIWLRGIACLRRIAKAMERSNDLEQHRQDMEFPVKMPTKQTIKKLQITHPTSEDWNRGRIPE
jgi:hypothetical protein